ncbi:MAG: glycosyl hydrolase 115 family protein, partial [Prevotellaceae bacterium]|nr:glycosyl hydrolase 115 family protein [Prevotellaceae bacterium]
MQSKVSTVVTKAASLFEDDMKALTGNECYESNQGEVAVYQLDMASNKELKALEMQQVPLLKFIARKDAFWIGKRGNQVVIVGSNGRGAAYGLLELSRMSGISVWKWWGDIVPERHQRLEIDENLDKIEVPSVEYRGINIDDIQWSSGPWARNYLKEQLADGLLGPAYYHKLFELMLRLKANTISAGWDKKASVFLDVKGNREVADSFSMIVATPDHDGAVTLHEHKKPVDIKILYADDGYGYMLMQAHADDKHTPHGAALYHLSFQGQPHDYLWLCTTQPGLVCNEMQTAYRQGADRLWMLTIHDPKVAAYQLNLFMDMAWNINAITPTTVQQHLQDWLSMQFGKQIGERLIKPMTNFYKLSAIRRPEFMGWNEAPAQGANALF